MSDVPNMYVYPRQHCYLGTLIIIITDIIIMHLAVFWKLTIYTLYQRQESIFSRVYLIWNLNIFHFNIATSVWDISLTKFSKNLLQVVKGRHFYAYKCLGAQVCIKLSNNLHWRGSLSLLLVSAKIRIKTKNKIFNNFSIILLLKLFCLINIIVWV